MEKKSSARWISIWGLLAVVVIGGSLAAYRHLNPPVKYQPKYQTIAHRFLNLEAKYVEIPDTSYALLDDVIDTVKSRTQYDPSITDRVEREKQFVRIFDAIDSVLIEKDFIFPPGQWTSTLGEALEDHPLGSRQLEFAMAMPHNQRRAWQMKHDADGDFHMTACVPAAFLYMGAAEALGFELKAVELPKHIFVRAQIDKYHWINWDPNRGRTITDEEYVSNWGVTQKQISEKVYMNPLSAAQLQAEMYANVGAYLANRSNIYGMAPGIECYHKSLELNPRSLYACMNLPGDLLFKPDPDALAKLEAMKLAQQAVEMDSNSAGTHEALAYALASNRQTTQAVTELTRAIDLDPQDEHAREMLPLIEAGMNPYEATKSLHPIGIWLTNENGIQYISIVVSAVSALGLILLIKRKIARKRSHNATEISAAPAMGQ